MGEIVEDREKSCGKNQAGEDRRDQEDDAGAGAP